MPNFASYCFAQQTGYLPVRIITRVHKSIYTPITTQSFNLPHTPSQQAPREFSDHILTLEPWAREILRHLNWVQDFDYVCDAFHNLPADLPLLVVSDGSSIKGQHMSFGVTFGLMDGQMLVELSGPASGPPSSHRAEYTGCLAGALFCSELYRFTHRPLPQLHIHAVADNQGMIRSLNDRMSYNKVYPNSTLRPDWDLLEEIITQYKSIPAQSVTFHWEKGHQDTMSSDRELTPQARFNIHSDALAAKYTREHGMSLTPETPRYPTTRCTLLLHGATITGNYRQNLRLAEAEPALFEYLISKHGWTDKVCDDVDWDAFCMAARSYSSTEVHLLKLVHDKLPMRYKVSQHQKWTKAECYYCSHPDTIDHLQRGTCNPASAKFRADIREEATQSYMQHQRCPNQFISIFLRALDHWTNADDLDTALLSDTTHRQSAIGWRLFTRGFLTRQWHALLQQLTSPREPNPSHVAHTIETTKTIAGLIKTMWGALSRAWLHHLDIIHQKSQCRQSPVTLASLKDRVRLIHALQPHTPSTHHHYFHEDLDSVLEKATIQSLQSYIQHYLPAIMRSLPNRHAQHPTLLPQSPSPANPSDISTTTFLGSSTHPSPFQTIHQSHPAQEEPAHRKHSRRRI